MEKILIIEDEADVADFIKRDLLQAGYQAEIAYTGQQGLEIAYSNTPDLVILDLMLPDMDGIDVCRELRKLGDVGIIILTARGLVGERVRGLEAGADDYVPKPFSFEELLARIRAVLRRRSATKHGIIRVGDLEINTERREVRRNGRTIVLTNREYELLALLAQNAGKPLPREFIIQRVWSSFNGESDPLKVYIRFLRRKLNGPGEADLIHTITGFGYVLREN